MDEWFLASDASSLEKARFRLENMVRDAEILVLSSYQQEIIRSWCSRVFWMEQGRSRDDGAPDEVLARYLGREPVPVPV
jgi:lipopolysaccharide transport system ATP-binding protein